MAYPTRLKYTDEMKSYMWDRYQQGDSVWSIARSFDRSSSSIHQQLSRTGGIRPADRERSCQSLSLGEREEISRGLVAGLSIRSIASQLDRAPSSISREISRNGGSHHYRATRADQNAWDRALRPKACKLVLNRPLCRVVELKLRRKWSPEQIAGWLKREQPGDEQNQVSHETIYRSLFIQARGAFKKELQQYLRSKRSIRRARTSTLKDDGLGGMPNAVSIRERPASVEDRAVPGHWEGDLIEGSRGSFIERLRRTLEEYRRNRRSRSRSRRPVVPTGVPALDASLPQGGLPAGAITELLSHQPGSGVMRLAIRCALQAVRAGGVIAVVDTQNNFYPPGAVQLGAPATRAVVSTLTMSSRGFARRSSASRAKYSKSERRAWSAVSRGPAPST